MKKHKLILTDLENDTSFYSADSENDPDSASVSRSKNMTPSSFTKEILKEKQRSFKMTLKMQLPVFKMILTNLKLENQTLRKEIASLGIIRFNISCPG